LGDPGLKELRTRVLLSFGATGGAVDELLAYNETPFGLESTEGLTLPLIDEAHLEAWDDYAEDARKKGVFEALAERLVQLQFPIREGMSQDADYRAATRRGVFPQGGGPGLALLWPGGLTLTLNPTTSGRVPILVVSERRDFVSLVQALSGRNEPIPVPDAMGACIVTGLNNWDRLARYRKAWEEASEDGSEEAWAEEFKTLGEKKEVYQDRFIILSSGPYSAVQAKDVGLSEEDWIRESVLIRREHECNHYFTYRVFGTMRNNLLDEVIADLVGLLHARKRYESPLALRFFGLEDFPRYRSGGRLESYLGSPRLSDAAVAVLRSLVHRTILNLEAFVESHPWMGQGIGRARLVLALATLSLEELAEEGMTARLLERISVLPGAQLSDDPIFRIEVNATMEGMDSLLGGLKEAAQEHASLKPVASDLHLALDEIVSNLVKHAPKARRPYRVLFEVYDRGLAIDAVLADDGPPFNPLATPEPVLEGADRPVGGLGIHLVRTLMDTFSYYREDDRNRLFMRKAIRRGE
jgi:anti-sigma regulatory factor (Ser/Thr protein kinase)